MGLILHLTVKAGVKFQNKYKMKLITTRHVPIHS